MRPPLIYSLNELNYFYPEDLPDIAIELIKNGNENQYLLELAGLNKPSKEQVGDLLSKGLECLIDKNFDLFDMGLSIARGIIDKEVDPYKGAFLIGELSEKLNRNEDFGKFKCLVMEFDDYEQDKGISNLGYDYKNIQIWQNDLIEEIKKDSKLLLKKYKTG